MSLHLVDSMDVIEKKILDAVVQIGNSKFPGLCGKIRQEIVSQLPSIFKLSSTYHSLIYGKLLHHFGFREGGANSKVDTIIEVLANSTHVDFNRMFVKGNSISGGIRVSAVRADFSDVLSQNEAYQTTDAGQQLPWLEWLLMEGDKVIIADYFFLPGNFRQSRSGNGIMVFDKTQYWRVPPEFAGVAADNWITRTISQYTDDISLIIEQAFKRYL